MIPYLGQKTSLRLSRERNNQLRSDLLRCAAADRAETNEIANAITHFCDGFDRCAANRNIIMHSRTVGASMKGDAIRTTLKKLSSGGDRYNEFTVPVEELRDIVDNTFRFDRYGERIWFHVVSNHHTDLAPSIDYPQRMPPPPPLPKQLQPDTAD
jgi:hypothetical protein